MQGIDAVQDVQKGSMILRNDIGGRAPVMRCRGALFTGVKMLSHDRAGAHRRAAAASTEPAEALRARSVRRIRLDAAPNSRHNKATGRPYDSLHYGRVAEVDALPHKGVAANRLIPIAADLQVSNPAPAQNEKPGVNRAIRAAEEAAEVSMSQSGD